MENPVLTSSICVWKNSKSVFLDFQKIKELAFCLKNCHKVRFSPDIHFIDNFERSLNFLLIVDCLNFCFWNKNGEWKISLKGKIRQGYEGLVFCLRDFFEKNPEYLEFKNLSLISFAKFLSIFQGKRDLYFLKKRWEILKKTSSLMKKKYQGSFLNFFDFFGGESLFLVKKIVKEIPSFKDERVYRQRKIYFYKRAQHLTANIWALERYCQKKPIKNIDKLTAFADYRLPQVLHHFGVLRYSRTLEKIIREKKLIKKECLFEIEIRANTVLAVEFLKEELKRLGRSFSSFEIDWLLWKLSQKTKFKLFHHLTKTIDY